MDFGSDSWGEDDSWGDDGDDGDDGWKRRKREAKEKTETMKRKAETVEKTRKKRRVVEEVETEEENKRVRREAAAKWRKGTQVCHSLVSSAKYLSQTFLYLSLQCLIFALGVPARGGCGGQGGEVQAGSKLHGNVAS